MKQLTCEMCGSTELIKESGFFVCQTCGCKYSVEEAKKMMIEGTVDVQGTVKVVGNAKNDMTGMYTVKIAVPDADDKIKVGMIADVVITTDTAEKVLAIPQNSILTDNGKTYVYVAEDNKAVKRTVTTGVASNDMIEITSGLTEGDAVICDGKEFLTDTNNTVNITAN